MMRTRWFALGAMTLLLLALAAGSASAEPRVQGLFAGRALFSLDGESFLLRDGESGPGGLRLVRATSRSALVEFQGRQQELTLERGRFGGVYQTRAQPELRILPDAQGGYTVRGLVNGHSIALVVDTGATLITLSEDQAVRLGLPLSDGARIPVETASGQVSGWRVALDSVQVGSLDERRVDAVVLPGDRPTVALLGMSFLSRLDIRNEGSVLVLQAR
jgi:aspartyl protease family protein